jgi:hypothetical protein
MRKPLSYHAARFSCFVPLGLFLVSPASTLSIWSLALFYLIDVVAFVAGIVGLIGGIQLRAAGTIRSAVCGMLLSGFPFAVLVLCALR